MFDYVVALGHHGKPLGNKVSFNNGLFFWHLLRETLYLRGQNPAKPADLMSYCNYTYALQWLEVF